MGRAAVRTQELDQSTRVPNFPGAYGGLVVAAKKGPVNVPQLVTTDADFLRKYTPDEKVDVGYDVSHYSALAYLQKSDKLYTVRAAKDALYGGSAVRSETSAFDSYTLTVGMADPTAFVFDESEDSAGAAQVTSVTIPTGTATANYDVVGTAKYFDHSSPLVDYYVWINVTNGVNTQADPAIALKTGVQVDVLATDDEIQMAVKAAATMALLADFNVPVPTTATFIVTNATVGASTDAADATAGVSIVVDTQGEDIVDLPDEVFLVYGANEGAWNNSIYYEIVNYTDDPDLVKEEDSFIIYVYKSTNLNVPVEEFLCSRVAGKLDGFNSNIYIEDVLEGSLYIRAFDNLNVAGTVLPKTMTSPLALGAGDDGTAVTDAEMILAAATLDNPSEVFMTILMDGGWATPAYQIELARIAESRGDCVAILSTPYSEEVSSSYLAALVDYRKTTLNISSSWAALYTPHVKIFDKFNDRDIFVAPDGYVGAVISATASNYEIWYPPAGFRRGGILVSDVRRKFKDAEMDVLYDAGINPIRFVAGRGINVWGQKTLLSRPSSLDRLNVRLLLIALIPGIKEALEDFLFEINDLQTRFQASTIVDAAVASNKARRGVQDYQIVADSSNNTQDDIDNYRMNIDLYIVPPRAVEDIRLKTIITRSSVEFSL